MSSRFEIRVIATDSRLADQATRSLTRLALRMGAAVEGPVPLPVVKGKLQPDETPGQLPLSRNRTFLYKRVLSIIDPSEDAMLELSNIVLPLGVQSHIRAVS